MKRVLVLMLGVLFVGGARAQQVVTTRGSRFDWPPVRLLVVADSTAGVEVFLFLDRSGKPGTETMSGQAQTFTPGDAVAWAAAAESSLADTLRFRPVTLLSHDSSTLVIARGRGGEASSGTAVLAYYPRPDTGNPQPLDIQLAPAQATAFLKALRVHALESRYDSAAPARNFIPSELVALMRPRPEVLSGPPPQYPEEMRSRGIEGTVELRAMVDTLGRVEPASIEVLRSSAEPFAAAAKRMVLKTRFRPAQLNGRAMRMQVIIPVRFTLGRR